jgi:Fic family protein
LFDLGKSTVRKHLKELVDENKLQVTGAGRSTKYVISATFELLASINLDDYYQKEMDDRNAKSSYDFNLVRDVLQKASLFTEKEQQKLNKIQDRYLKSIQSVEKGIYKKRLEVLAIDLIWKSSEIEGNTYSLLETEALIKQHELAKGKSKEDATMLLNHKKALDFITDDLDYLKPLTVNKIIDIHTLLIGGLGVSNNIRRRAVAITGTNYRPLSIETQIKEELEEIVNLVNSKNNIFEKGLLLLCLLSYLQAFEDGNKRTARIMSNAVLMSHKYCPLSFRTVSAVDYKKAMLLFYEQNNISAMKEIFIHQYEFAVKQYFDL